MKKKCRKCKAEFVGNGKACEKCLEKDRKYHNEKLKERKKYLNFFIG